MMSPAIVREDCLVRAWKQHRPTQTIPAITSLPKAPGDLHQRVMSALEGAEALDNSANLAARHEENTRDC